MRPGYPDNLILAIFREIDFEITEDTKKGLDFVLGKLTEREKTVLQERYVHGKTYKKIGEIFRVTPERIKQIHNGALRKMRNPARSAHIKHGYCGYREILKKSETDTNQAIGCKDISELDLSTRAYNSLKRSRINNISDIKSMEQLRRIRNLGQKTLSELIEKLNAMGYELSEHSIEDEW